MNKKLISIILSFGLLFSSTQTTSIVLAENNNIDTNSENIETIEQDKNKLDDALISDKEENVDSNKIEFSDTQKSEKSYTVSNARELQTKLEEIKNAPDTEITIVLNGNIDTSAEFSGVKGKNIILKSEGSNKFTFNLAENIQGDIVLDNVKLAATETNVYSSGNKFETTANFEGTITNIYGGGNGSTEVNGDTNLILRGGNFRSIYGGGYNSTVIGDTNVIFDGASIAISNWGNNQRVIGGGYGDGPNKGVVNGNTNVKIISGTLGVTTSAINGNQDNGCGIYAGGFNKSNTDFSTSAMVTGNTNLEFGGKNDGDIIVGNDNGYVRGANYSSGSYRSTILGNANLTLKEGSQMAYIDQYGNMKTPNLYGGGLEDHIKGVVNINISGGNNMQWRDNFGETKGSQDGITLYLGGKINKDNAVNENGPIIENVKKEPYAATLNMTGGSLAKVYAVENVSPFYANSKYEGIRGNVKVNISGESTEVAEIHGSYSGGAIEQSNENSKSEITVANQAKFRSVSDTEQLELNNMGSDENEARIKLLQRINNVILDNSYIYIGYKAWYSGATYKTECMPWVKNLTLKNNSVLHTDNNAITTIKNHKIDNKGGITADLGAKVKMIDSSWIADEVVEVYGSMNMENSKLILKSNSMGGSVLANFNTVKEDFNSENSELYLNVVDPQNGNYSKDVDKDPNKVIRLQINGKASGDCKVYATQTGKGPILEKPKKGGNYIIANTKSDFNTFKLANDDAVEEGLGFVKKYGRIKVTTGGSGIDKKFATMWQIGDAPILKKYKVSYEFENAKNSPTNTGLDLNNMQLPKDVTTLLPKDDTEYEVGREVTADNPKKTRLASKYEDKENNIDTYLLWNFEGYTQDKLNIKDGENKFVGKWSCNDIDLARYTFVSDDKNKELPKEIKGGVPETEAHVDIEKYDEVEPKYNGKKEIKVSDGTWDFIEWKVGYKDNEYDWPEKPIKVHDDVKFIGVWHFTPNSTGGGGGGTIVTPPTDPDRIEGNDRIETSVETSKDLYPNGTNAVVLANAERYTDVLTADPFAIQEKASALLTYKYELPEKTLKEIERLGAKKIYISGGYDAVSKKVVNELAAKGYEIFRFDGVDRYDTARKIAIKIREKGNTNAAELASGEDFPDALCMTPLAVKDRAPILLTKKDSIPKYTKQALAEWDIENIKIGGLDKAVSPEVEKQLKAGFEIEKNNKKDSNVYDGAKVVKRIGGEDRYETSAKLAKESYPESKLGVYATGEDFPDALIAGNYAGTKEAPVLLVKGDSLPEPIEKYTKESKIKKATIIGGVNAVSDKVFNLIKAAINK